MSAGITIFISAMTDSLRNSAIVTSTLQLEHALGLVQLAEGVEGVQDQELVDALQTLRSQRTPSEVVAVRT